MIKNLRIANFRGFKLIEITDSGRFNLIVGRNNSGKTTLLESLFIFIAPSNIGLALKINSFRDLDVIDPGYWSNMFYKSDPTNEIVLEGVVKVRSGIENRSLKVLPSYVQKLNGQERAERSPSDGPFAEGTSPEITGLKWEYTLKKEGESSLQFELTIGRKGEVIEGTSVSNYVEPLKGIFLGPATQQQRDIAMRFSQVVIDKGTDRIVKLLQKIDSSIVDLKIANNNVYCDVGTDKLLPLNLMGGGVWKALSLIVAVYYCRDGVMLIDEFENGLHHTTIEAIWRGVIESAYEFNVQVFATTHSYECIASYNKVIEERLQLLDDFRLARLEKKGDSFRMVDLDSKDVRVALEKNWEIR